MTEGGQMVGKPWHAVAEKRVRPTAPGSDHQL